MKLSIRLVFVLLVVAATAPVEAQTNSQKVKDYIARYAPIAIEQQALYGIPASITLAQGIVESNFGTSFLATTHNNHFGIKCGGTWSGRSVGKVDDEKDDKGRDKESCFRSYNSDSDSFTDHSLFLSERSRYSGLFDLDVYDYKGWARGLKAAGYATNPQYADMLIARIETYELYRYDHMTVAEFTTSSQSDNNDPTARQESKPTTVAADRAVPEEVIATINPDNFTVSLNSVAGYGIYSSEGARYVVARATDTLDGIADATGIAVRRLRRYNRLPKESVVMEGQRIFIEAR